MNSYSLAGDVTCISCPSPHYSPQESAICFPIGRIGGIMKVDMDFDAYKPNDWTRSIANVLSSEVSDIHLETYRPGSVINYFDIVDPSNDTIISGNDFNGVSQLSGNEKILLLFQWWLLNDERITELPYKIIDFKLFAENTDNEVVTLFAEESNSLIPQFPYNPYRTSQLPSSSSHTSITTLPNDTTIEFIINSSPRFVPPLFTIMALFVFIFL